MVGGINVRTISLVARGCKHVIVIHLDNGLVWNRHDFSEQTIIEIRPEDAINKSDLPLIGCIDGLLDFDAERIVELKRRGYEDAQRCLESIILSFTAVREQPLARDYMVDSTNLLLNDSALY